MVLINIPGTGPRPRKLQVDQSGLRDTQESIEKADSVFNSLLGATKLVTGLIDNANTEKIESMERSAKAGLTVLSNAVTDSAVKAGTEAGLGDGPASEMTYNPEEFKTHSDNLFPAGFKWHEGRAKKASKTAREGIGKATKQEWEDKSKLAFDNARLERGINIDVAEGDTRVDVNNKAIAGLAAFVEELQTSEGKDKGRHAALRIIKTNFEETIREPSSIIRDPMILEDMLEQLSSQGGSDADVDMLRRAGRSAALEFAGTQQGQQIITATLTANIDINSDEPDAYREELEKFVGLTSTQISSLVSSARGNYIVKRLEEGMDMEEARYLFEDKGYVPSAVDMAQFVSLPQVGQNVPISELLSLLNRFSDGGVLYISDTEWSRLSSWFSVPENRSAWSTQKRFTKEPVQVLTVNNEGKVSNAAVPGGGGSGGGGGGGGSSFTDKQRNLLIHTGQSINPDDSQEVILGEMSRTLTTEIEALELPLHPKEMIQLRTMIVDGELGYVNWQADPAELSANIAYLLQSAGVSSEGNVLVIDPMGINKNKYVKDMFDLKSGQYMTQQPNGQYEIRTLVEGAEKGKSGSLPVDRPTYSLREVQGRKEEYTEEMRAVIKGVETLEKRLLELEGNREEASDPTTEASDPTTKVAPIVPDPEAEKIVEKALERDGGSSIGNAEVAGITVAAGVTGLKYMTNKRLNQSFTTVQRNFLKNVADGTEVADAGKVLNKLLGSSSDVDWATFKRVAEALGLDVSSMRPNRVDAAWPDHLPDNVRARQSHIDTLKRHISSIGPKELHKTVRAIASNASLKKVGSVFKTAGRFGKRAVGGPAGWTLLAIEMVGMATYDEQVDESLQERYPEIRESFEKEIASRGIFSFDDYTPYEGESYTLAGLHYFGEFLTGNAKLLKEDFNKGNLGMGYLANVARTFSQIFVEEPARIAKGIAELSGNIGKISMANQPSLQPRRKNPDTTAKEISGYMYGHGQLAEDKTVAIYNNADGFAFSSKDHSANQVRPLVQDLSSLAEGAVVVPEGLKDLVSGEFSSSILDTDRDYRSSNEELLQLIDPEGKKEGNMPSIDIRNGMFWQDKTGTGTFDPNSAFLLPAERTSDVIDFLEVVSSDQDNVTFSRREVKAARSFLIDFEKQKIPRQAFKLVKEMGTSMADGHLSEIESDSLLHEWNHYTASLPDGDPLEWADNWYIGALASNENIPEGMPEQFTQTLSDFFDWARSQEDPSVALVSSEIEGLTDQAKLTLDLISWINIGAPDAKGFNSGNRTLADLLPLHATDPLSGRTFMKATGISIDPESMKYGYKFELKEDTPEFLIYLRDVNSVPKNLAEFTSEYGFWRSRVYSVAEGLGRQGAVNDIGPTVRDWLYTNLGVNSENVGRIENIDPSLTGPDEPREAPGPRARPYSREEMRSMTDRILSGEIQLAQRLLGKDFSGPYLPESQREVITRNGWPRYSRHGQHGIDADREALWELPLLEGGGDAKQVYEAINNKLLEIQDELARNETRRLEKHITAKERTNARESLTASADVFEGLLNKIEVHMLYEEQVGSMPSSGVYLKSWEEHSRNVEARLRATRGQ